MIALYIGLALLVLAIGLKLARDLFGPLPPHDDRCEDE